MREVPDLVPVALVTATGSSLTLEAVGDIIRMKAVDAGGASSRRFIFAFGHGARERSLGWGCCALLAAAWAGGCSPAKYKAQADAEVYGIIDKKWQDRFGEKVNYTVSDVPASPNDVRVDPGVPSRVLSLPQAVAIATARNRDYPRQKELLYLTALDLALVRHQFARQWFGTVDARYVSEGDADWVSSEGTAGFNQLLASGATVSTAIAPGPGDGQAGELP